MPSITALSVIIGTFLCYHMKNFSQLIASKKAVLFEHMATKMIKKYPITLSTIIFKLVFLLPYTIQIKILHYFSPGYCVHMVMRKQYIEDTIRSAVEDEIKQVVICAAGLDMTSIYLASELKHVSGLKFFELDLESTQKYKKYEITQLIASGKINKDDANKVNYVGCDLSSDDWHQNLLNSGFDPKQPVIVVAEGFTMYLKKEHVSNFLQSVKKNLLQNDHSLFITSFFTVNNTISPPKTGRLIKFLLKKNNEPYQFHIPFGKVIEFCAQNELQVVDFRTRKQFQELANNDAVIRNSNEQTLSENYYIMRPVLE